MSDEYTSSGAVISDRQTVQKDEVWCNTTVSSGGYVNVYGSASGTSVDQFVVIGPMATIKVQPEGSVEKLTVSSGGSLIIAGSNGKEAAAAEVVIKRGGSAILRAGNADNFIVSGVMKVSSGGKVIDSVISGGTMTLQGGGTAENTILKNGMQILSAKGSLLGGIVSGGSQIVSSGGLVTSATVSGGSQIISSGGSAVESLLAGGTQIVSSGGTAADTRVGSGGVLRVSSGGILGGENTLVTNGGQLHLSAGAVVESNVYAMGEVYISENVDFSNENAGLYLWIDQDNTASLAGNAILHNFSLMESGVMQKCFIALPGNITDGTYAIADGAGDFNGSFSIYNDDWSGSHVQVSVGDSIYSNGISIFLDNNEGKLSVTVVNDSYISRKLSEWTPDEKEKNASTALSIKFAGRYIISSFNEGENFSGAMRIYDSEGTVVGSFSFKEGIAQRKEDLFLEAGEYTVVCTPNSASQLPGSGSSCSISSTQIFYRTNMYDDDDWQELGEDVPETVVEFSQSGNKVTEIISNPVDGQYYEFVGYQDAVDWRKITISNAGAFTVNLTKGTNAKSQISAVLYSYNGLSLEEVAAVVMADNLGECDLISKQLLEAGTYYLQVSSDFGAEGYGTDYGATITGTPFDVYNDNVSNQLFAPQTRIEVDPAEDNSINAVIVPEGEYISAMDADWRQINLNASGVCSINLTQEQGSTAGIKAVLYKVNGTKLTAVASATVSAAASTAALFKDKNLEAGTYYLEIRSASKAPELNSSYGVSITGRAVREAPGENTLPLTTAESFSTGTKTSGEVNFSTPEQYYSWQVTGAGNYKLSLSPDLEKSMGNNSLTVTVYSFADGKTAPSKVMSFTTKNNATQSDSKAFFLEAGTYFVSVKSSSAPKGAEVKYTFIGKAEERYPVDQNTAENFLEAESCSLAALPGKQQYAGFGAEGEFLKLAFDGKDADGGVYNFKVANSGNGNGTVTIWMWNGTALKKVKSVSAAAGKEVLLKNVTLNSSGIYYLQYDGASAAKSKKYAELTVTAQQLSRGESTPELYSGADTFTDAEVITISSQKAQLFSDRAWGGEKSRSWFDLKFADDAAAGGTFNFTVSNSGTGSVTVSIYQLAPGGISVKKIKSVTVKAKSSGTLAGLDLAAGNEYFVMVDGSAAAKKGSFGRVSISADAAALYSGTPQVSENADDNDIWQLEKAENTCFTIAKSSSVKWEGGLDSSNSTDFRKITLEHAGFYNFTLEGWEKNANLTATLYKWNDDGSALVKVSAVTINTKTFKGSLKNDLFLAAGDYYVSVTCANTAKGGFGEYELTFTAPRVFNHADTDLKDNAIDGTLKSLGTGKSIKGCYVGAGDECDYFRWNVEDDGYYNFTLDATDQNANLTAVLYKWNDAGTALVKVGSVTAASGKGPASLKKDLLLDKGEYFVSVTCANTAKGGYGTYNLSASASAVFHPDVSNGDDDLAGAAVFDFADGKEGFVGYGDENDFLKLSAETSGEYNFSVDVTDAVKFTLYRYDSSSGKMTAVIKTTTLKSDDSWEKIHLEKGEVYYAHFQAVNKKGEALYTLTAEGSSVPLLEARIDGELNDSMSVAAMKQGESSMFNFDVGSADAGWSYAFNSEVAGGDILLYKYDTAKALLTQVKMIEGEDMLLAEGSYYIELKASRAVENSAIAFDAESRSFTWS